MPVSRTRRKVTSHQVRRRQERRQVQARAQYRSRCIRQALHAVLQARGLHEVAGAMAHAGRIGRIPEWEHCRPYHLEPRQQLSDRAGWKRVGYDEYGESERWIYVPSIPQGWDESSSNQPTELLWDGDRFELTPVRGPDHPTRPPLYFDNPMRLYLMLERIESW